MSDTHRTLNASLFMGSVTRTCDALVTTCELYFFSLEESHISMTGPWPSTVKNFRWSSIPNPSKFDSTTHIHLNLVRSPCNARPTATRKASFLTASLTRVNSFNNGFWIFTRASTSVNGVAGKRGAPSSHLFNSLVQVTIIFSIRAGTTEMPSITLLCQSSSSFVRCSPRPSAKRSFNASSIRGTNFWKLSAKHSSKTSITDSLLRPSHNLSRRKLTHAATFAWVPEDSLPCCSKAHKHPSGNCCVRSSNLLRFCSTRCRKSSFLCSSTRARVF
mmetsp:Transcript_61542/g.109502  ORF Transcript_61542/g.109502 Transcript_61542/m.109502 type:complete len:274 (+) Transcript_61542:1701-2522(+)